MARLFTTKLASDDLEIVLYAPETENIESSQNSNKMTVNGIVKNKTNVKNKLTGTWIKLLTLPPQELVPELKVNYSCETGILDNIPLLYRLFMNTCLRLIRITWIEVN